MSILLAWVAMAVAVAVTVAVFPGIDVDGGVGTYLWIAAVLGVLNLLVRPILRLLSAPLLLLTLGLFSLVINAVVLLIADWVVGALDIDGFLPALGGALVLAVVNMVIAFALEMVTRRSRRA